MRTDIVHLKKDKVLSDLIDKYGELSIHTPRENIFADIVDSIISQQLSTKAAATIYKRFIALFNNDSFPTPKEILQVPDEKIRECGISYPKIKYIKGVAEAVEKKELNLESLRAMSDEEALNELVKLKGIGKWTAEMILMFTLARKDVFSLGDVGLKNAISKLYGVNREDLSAIEKISLRWSPFRSLACRYLWKSLDNEPTV